MIDSTGASRLFPRAAPSGTVLLTLAGLAAAFGAASCCALPLLLGGLGLGTAWLAGVALLAAPHRGMLVALGAVALFGGAVLLWRQERIAATCTAGAACTGPRLRALLLAGLLIGMGLLAAGSIYA